jgi:hypothetical protein
MKCPITREADNLNCRFIDQFESYFRSITTPGIEPINNLAEQAIRFVAIHRRITLEHAAPQAKPGANASGRSSPLVGNKATRCFTIYATRCNST